MNNKLHDKNDSNNLTMVYFPANFKRKSLKSHQTNYNYHILAATQY